MAPTDGDLRERLARLEAEHAALRRERDAALEREHATTTILGIISRTPMDLQPVLEAIVEQAHRLCQAEQSILARVEGDTFRFVAGKCPSKIGVIYPLSDAGITAECIRQGRTLQVAGTLDDIAASFPLTAKRQRPAGYDAAALLAVPLLRNGQAIGALYLLRQGDSEPFPETQVALIETFAQQAVVAIENARLFQDLTEALEHQRATSEVLEVISRSPSDLQAVLDLVVERSARLSDSDDAIVLLIDGDRLFALSSWGDTPAIPRPQPSTARGTWTFRFLTRESAGGHAFLERRTVSIHGGPETVAATYPLSAEVFQQTGSGSGVFVPLIEGERVLGWLQVRRAARDAYTAVQIALLEGFARQAVIAMQNARLFEEIQQKTRELEEANRHKSAFISSMSHELRTPLNAIIGYSEMLQEEAEDIGQDSMTADLGKVNAAGKHLLSLINNVLDLSKIEAGRMDLFLEDFAVADLIQDVTAVVQPLVEQNGNALAVEVEDDLGVMHADLTKVRQALFNLLSNAAKFTEGGVITLSITGPHPPTPSPVPTGEGEPHATEAERARPSPAGAGEGSGLRAYTFTVADTGIGMTEEQQAKLFQAFSQAGADTSARFGGTGLGLALSREFCRMLGGDITVTSTPGEGSTFTIRLPARVPDASAREAGTTAAR